MGQKIVLDGRKAFTADHMLDPAGVCGCRLRVHTKLHEAFGQELMPFIDHLRNLLSFLRQINKTGRSNGDQILFPQIFHGDADAGFFVTKFIGNIYRPHHREFLT